VQHSLDGSDIINKYNGEEEVQIDLKLVSSEDISKLFN